MIPEQWRPVVGFEGKYEVSDAGRVRNARTYRVLRDDAKISGHRYVCLGRRNMRYVHRLVVEAFRGPAPKAHECRHLDDNPGNNALGNLVWGTKGENNSDKVRNRKGYKLSPDDVVAIRYLYPYVSAPELAANYGISNRHVYAVVNRRCHASI